MGFSTIVLPDPAFVGQFSPDVAATSYTVLTASIKPTNGTLGTDDVTVSGFWIEFTRLVRTS